MTAGGSTETTTWLAVRPLDTVMVRDGRPFVAGANSRAAGGLPPPSTLGGVVHAALGGGEARDPDYLIGPMVAAGGHLLFPPPADLVRDDTGQVIRLAVRPRIPGTCTDLDDVHPFSHELRGDGDLIGEMVTGPGLAAWLGQDKTEPYSVSDEQAAAWLCPVPWSQESRVGLARHWDGEPRGTARAGMLYAAAHLRLDVDARFLVGCVDREPTRVTRPVVPLGGRGRLASVEQVTVAPVLPSAPDSFPGGRVAVYLATPALLPDVFWTPPGTDAVLSALALRGPHPVASASPRQGVPATRQLVWTVPAGTVFYLTFGSAESAWAWARDWHGRLLPGSAVPAGGVNPRMITAGFGTCLIGRW